MLTVLQFYSNVKCQSHSNVPVQHMFVNVTVYMFFLCNLKLQALMPMDSTK